MPILAGKQSARVASILQTHPRVQTLRSNPAIVESTLYAGIPPLVRDNMFTWCHVRGPGRMTVEPLVFTDKQSRALSVVFHLGDGVAGYPGLVAGGVLATIMDEALSMCALIGSDRHFPVTERLEMCYQMPVATGEFYILEAKVVGEGEGEGLCCRVEGTLKLLNSGKSTLVTGVGEFQPVLVRSIG